uniref:Uncharacterized protein n=1 Tax=Ascaris lumbricoides TaxID=6252 RepID=A0A0M3HZE9_ASCLU
MSELEVRGLLDFCAKMLHWSDMLVLKFACEISERSMHGFRKVLRKMPVSSVMTTVSKLPRADTGSLASP